MTIKYSIVIPLKDEEDNIEDLLQEVDTAMASLNEPWEIICIDDGSTDNTRGLLQKSSKTKKHLKVISFTRNFGQSSAFDAGFKSALGDYVITLDGDRQNDPADIPKMVAAAQHADLVCGIRAKRKDPVIKRLTSLIANSIRKRLCDDGVQDTGCSLKIYRRSCLQKIKMYQGMHRFLPALFKIEGFKVAEIPVNHRERTRGKTKYNFFNRSFNTIADMFAVRWMNKRQLRYTIKKDAS